MREAVMGTRENSIATWCKRFQIDLWKIRDRMKSGELTVYEKRADGKFDITPAAMVKLKELITQIEGAFAGRISEARFFAAPRLRSAPSVYLVNPIELLRLVFGELPRALDKFAPAHGRAMVVP
jgi:hypothetical protein